MTKTHYFNFHGPKTIAEIANAINGEISNERKNEAESSLIYNIKNIEDATSGDLAFISNKKYLNLLTTSSCSACIVDRSCEVGDIPKDIILITCEDAYYAYSQALTLLFSEKRSLSKNHISEKATIGKNVILGFNVIIEDGVIIEDNTYIDNNVVIKQNVHIGKNCIIGASSYIAFAQIGDNVIIHPGVKIGTDGFGFATHKGVHNKILHIGSVIVGNNVEIGANSCIDRGSNKDTKIGKGTIIDNLVQIGHNVEIGTGCIIVAQVGIAGSTKLGDYVVVGGQAGIAGHLKIANFVQIAGKSGVISNIENEKQIVGGYPSQPIRDWHKQTILLKKMLNNGK